MAIEDLRYLQARYVRYADAGDWRALAGLFLPEAPFIPHGVDGEPQVVMTGRGEIERRVSATVGSGTALHHLFSYEIDIDSPTKARGLWAMEDWIDRSKAVPAATASTKVRGLWAAEDPDGPGRAAASADVVEITDRPFRTMHGYGHYHAAYQKVDGSWFIAELKLFRIKLDFTY
ncbi:nuclear transport factor 2 family protein [Dyella sp. Tek66A03]|uniref:nuclear transport factor 2 family protein n=1 Tax=Dyella sp. Tek66A03 TaxID=3458298 RepID=UPI00403E691C